MEFIWDNIALILTIGFFGIIIIFGIVSSIVDTITKNKDKLKEAEEIIRKKQIIDEETLLLLQKQDNLEKHKTAICNIIKDSSLSSPWLAKRFADYFEIADNEKIKYLLSKQRPARSAADVVKMIKDEKKELLTNYKLLQYQQDTLFSLFPWLEDAIELDVKEIQESSKTINENKSDYDTIKEYLNPIEYQNLSNSEKYQLALERYLKKKKTLWQIGISYERYIGYIYENKKYKVIFNGAINGLNDLGRDLIAENKNEILIIQCKYWRKERIIHENVIFQLYGTMILKQLQTKKKVKGILATTTTLSDEAKKIAKYLNILIKENENFDKAYPCIKCNINRTSKEKIYHLPFDQQYDRIQISIDEGERYVNTVKEAESLGFRRAMRHFQK